MKQKKFKYLKKILINENLSIKKTLAYISKIIKYTNGVSFAIIVDDDNCCKGVVTDGDVRRALAKNVNINSPIKKVIKKNFVFVDEKDDYHKAIRLFDKNVKFVPVLSKSKKPIDLYLKYQFYLSNFNFDEKIVRARAPMRVSFSGGGTDFTNFMEKFSPIVLTTTINKFCTASIIQRRDKFINIISKDLNKSYKCSDLNSIKFDGNLDLIKSVILTMQPDFGFDLEIFSEAEPGTGLGGSSALVVSVISAFNYFRKTNPLNSYQIADLAYKTERIDQQIQGGWQDQYASSFGGFNLISFSKNNVSVEKVNIHEETQLELEYNLMLFKLKSSRKTLNIQKKYIKDIKYLKNRESFIKNIKKLTIEMKNSLLNSNVKKFGDLLHKSWTLKKKLNHNVSNDYIEKCYSLARNEGALGGKLLGAGEGGYLLIYSSPLYHLKIKKKLSAMGARFENLRFTSDGIKVWMAKR